MDLGARLYYSDMYAHPPRHPDSGRGDRYPGHAEDVDEAQLSGEIRAVIARIEDRVLTDRGWRLREDAKCFLLLNAQYMIAQPILETGRMPWERFREDLEEDLYEVLNHTEAGPHPSPNEPAEVSGNEVARAYGRVQPERTSRFSVWNT